MKTARIAAAQTADFREDAEAALDHVVDVAARARTALLDGLLMSIQ